MAEPVGIVGTAAGIVSLGIQTYGGIAAYLDSYKDREHDLKIATAQLANLRGSLAIIDQAKPRLATKSHLDTTSLACSIKSCEDELKKLDELLRRLSSSSAPTSTSAIKDQRKKLTFPFHRPSLTKLEESLERTNNVLQTVLQSLEL